MASELPAQLQTLSQNDVRIIEELFDLLKSGDANAVLEQMQRLSGKLERDPPPSVSAINKDSRTVCVISSWTATPVGRVLAGQLEEESAGFSDSVPGSSPPRVQPTSLPEHHLPRYQDAVPQNERHEVVRSPPVSSDGSIDESQGLRPIQPAQTQLSFIQSSELADGDDDVTRPAQHLVATMETHASDSSKELQTTSSASSTTVVRSAPVGHAILF